MTLVDPRSAPLDELVPGARAGHNPVLVYLAGLNSPHSKRTMLNALKRILAALGSPLAPAAFPWERVTYAEAVAVRAALVAHHQAASVNQSLAALRGVLREAFRLGLVDGETWTRVKEVAGVKVHRLPAGRYVPAEELGRLFGACDRSDPRGVRDAALLGTLRTTGCRRSEVCSLALPKAVNLTTGEVTLLGKGNKQRLGYLGDALVEVEAWLEVRGTAPGPLFWGQALPGQAGDGWHKAGLTEGGVYAILQRIAVAAHVPPLGPHDLRRTFVTDLLYAGVDLATVQRLAGHSDPRTTSLYDRRGLDAAREAASFLKIPR